MKGDSLRLQLVGKMKLLAHLLACMVGIFLMRVMLPDMIQYDSYVVAVAAGLILWLVDILVRPVVKLLTLPINILTLGLFTLVINALMVLLMDALVPSLKMSGFFAAMILAIMVSILQVVMIRIFREDH